MASVLRISHRPAHGRRGADATVDDQLPVEPVPLRVAHQLRPARVGELLGSSPGGDRDRRGRRRAARRSAAPGRRTRARPPPPRRGGTAPHRRRARRRLEQRRSRRRITRAVTTCRKRTVDLHARRLIGLRAGTSVCIRAGIVGMATRCARRVHAAEREAPLVLHRRAAVWPQDVALVEHRVGDRPDGIVDAGMVLTLGASIVHTLDASIVLSSAPSAATRSSPSQLRACAAPCRRRALRTSSRRSRSQALRGKCRSITRAIPCTGMHSPHLADPSAIRAVCSSPSRRRENTEPLNRNSSGTSPSCSAAK